MEVRIEPEWKSVLKEEFKKPYFRQLTEHIKTEKAQHKQIFPVGNNIFHAFECTPFNQVKLVILGQDPYHGPGQAHGLSFSVPRGVPPPPSLMNIFKELEADTGMRIPSHGNLEHWARQGVLLLNTSLTVRAGEPMSHSRIGWQLFTDKIIEKLSGLREHLVFFLWGKFAQEKAVMIDASKHLVLKAPHPSPLSAHTGFFGCRHFSKANDYLAKNGIDPIDWSL
jgi:uracil-DNA glycosylase